MNNNIIKVLRDKNYVVPSYILENYTKLNISIDSFVILIYLINSEEPITFDIKKISQTLNIEKKSAMLAIEELKKKTLINVKLEENKEKKLEENIYLTPLYEKVFMDIIDKPEEKEENIYSSFEEEFGRTLSPIEYELINSWNELYSKEIILEALKESVLSGVKNLKYVDRILFEWNKKGIKSLEQIRKDKEIFAKKKQSNIEIPDFDWVNDEQDI